MGDYNFGVAGGIARFDSFHGRQEGGAYHGSLRYPSPFFDIGHTYLPTSIKQMLRWCRYYFLTNPLINAVSYKMAEYPITQIIFDIEDQDLRDQWENISENLLKMRTFMVEVGLDYFTYGNAFITIHFPFQKYLICTNCKHEVQVSKAAYKFRNLRYHLACEKCGVTTEANVRDNNIKSLKDIRLIRWNPEYLTVEVNEITGEASFFFEIPTQLKNDILMGKRHIVETIPDIFVEALRKSQTLRFTSENLFHLKRPTIAQRDMGWGMPLILPVLKDTYYLQILRKGQEAIAQQHIVPLRLLFPQAGSASADPYSTTDLGMWRRRIEAEIQKWRVDPNYIPIMPMPLGNETIGGEGRALMLHQEMRAWSEQIVAGMQVPSEFIFGGMQYSGSNVSMRMLENQFLGYRTNLLIMVRDFVFGRISDYMGLTRPKCHFKRFKMADDLQKLALTFQMNQALKVSDTTLMDEADFDIVQEEKHKAAELNKQLENQRKMQLAQAALQGEVQVLTTRYQIEAQKLMTAAQIPPGGQPAPSGEGGAGSTVPAGGQMPGMETQQPMQGDQAAPGMPDGATAYPENGQQAPTEGVPLEMMSPLTVNQNGGQMDIMYLARRSATYLEKLDGTSRQIELMRMRGQNPQLYSLTVQLLQDQQGSQADALNPMQSPMPEQRPPRRQKPLV